MINDVTKPLVILGASGFGKEVAWIAKRIGVKVLGFLDDGYEVGNTDFYNHSILGKISDWKKFKHCQFIIAIANPRIRKSIVEHHFLLVSPQFATLIDINATLDLEDVSVGDGVIIHSGVICTANVSIGNHAIINKMCSIGHDSCIKDFVTISPQVMLGGACVLNIGCEIGAASAIRQSVLVGEGAMVGMGAIATQDISPNTLYLGVPAKAFKNLEKL